MRLEDVKVIAKERGIQPGKQKKADLIRAIQRTEGNEECYASGKAENCGQQGCLWRDDC